MLSRRAGLSAFLYLVVTRSYTSSVRSVRPNVVGFRRKYERETTERKTLWPVCDLVFFKNETELNQIYLNDFS